jgi:hypothetical protein
MKKKVFLIVLVLILAASTGAFAIGIGGAFSSSPIGPGAYYGGGALSLKLDGMPLLGISGYSNSGVFALGGTADWWMVNENLSGILNYYAGIGGYAHISLGSPTAFGFGARIPLGLNAYVLDPLELFLEIAPAIGVSIGTGSIFDWGLQSAIGFRFWF